MDDDDRSRAPIPTYEEAIARDDHEHRGLLSGPSHTYRSATVESARSSLDSDLGLPEVAGDGDEARRQVEELDYLDPADLDTSRRSPRLYHRSRLRSKFSISNSWSQLSATLSSIRLPSFRSLYTPLSNDHSSSSGRPSRFASLRRLLPQCSIPEQYRMSVPTIARLCGLFIIMALIYILFAFDLFPNAARQFGGARYDPESVRAFVQEKIDKENIKEALHHITSYDHVAGTKGDLFMAEWMERRWQELGQFDQLALLPYHVYLNYPGERCVSIVSPEQARWTAALEEDKVYNDRVQTLTWHGHSRSGDVEGHLVYANSGSRQDFGFLVENGVIMRGSIALVKNFGDQNYAMKLKAAQEVGCAGLLVYSDPSDVDPSNPWRPSDDMVQRESVSFTNWVVGDPLTPGYASSEDAKRASKDGNTGLPDIPSLPLSWRDAKHLLQSLSGHGMRVPDSWVHGPEDFAKSWFSGNISEGDKIAPVVKLRNLNEEEPKQKIWNLHGVIEGVEQPDKKIIVGNHRDSWCFGAASPGSGSAIMLEVVRVFGELRRLQPGWRPLRTIEFVSWDAAEYNLAGSTEYVEDRIQDLRQNGVAYVNVDVGVAGPNFKVAGSPIYQKMLGHVLNRVADPNSQGSKSLGNIFDERSRPIDGLGTGSDYLPFQTMAGMSSVDIGFGGSPHAYPSHSCHETFEWMTEFGDPDFEYHRALAQVWALLILELADSPLVGFDITHYSDSLREHVAALERDAGGLYAKQHNLPTASAEDVMKATNFTTQPLLDAAGVLSTNAKSVHRFEDVWTSNVLGAGGFETRVFAFQRYDYNSRMAKFEKDLLEEHGIPGREQFKHVVIGPSRWGDGADAFFPAVRDAMEDDKWEQAQEMLARAAERIQQAASNLVT